MLKVVFTGPAIDSNGCSILRHNLTTAAHSTGNLLVQASFSKDTDILVASRTDTQKAKKASERGILTRTYPQFLKQYLRGVLIETGGVPSKYTDLIDKDLIVPDFTNNDNLVAMDKL